VFTDRIGELWFSTGYTFGLGEFILVLCQAVTSFGSDIDNFNFVMFVLTENTNTQDMITIYDAIIEQFIIESETIYIFSAYYAPDPFYIWEHDGLVYLLFLHSAYNNFTDVEIKELIASMIM